MIAHGLRAAGLSGAAFLAIAPTSTEGIALWGVLITSGASLIAQYLKSRSERDARVEERKDHEQRHRHEMDERAALRDELQANTALTRQAGRKADAAYEVSASALNEANNVNAKIASATNALLGIAQKRKEKE